FNAMLKEAEALNDQYSSSLDTMAGNLERLNAIQASGKLKPGVYQQAHDDITGVSAQRAELARQRAIAQAEKQARVEAALAREQAHHNALIHQANALNLKHASALEVLKQKQLQLNALKATGALTERAYNAEMRAANTIYRE